MKNFIDIHSHILPGVDDGADSFEMSMQMLRHAAADGISGIICTPHNKPDRRHVPFSNMVSRVEKLREMMAEEAVSIELHTGSEMYYRSGIMEEMRNDMAGTMAGSRYVLVEFDPLADYEYLRNGINTFLMGGYHPILAHAERYQNVATRRHGVDDLIDMGCCIQVNAGSITGKSGPGTKRFVKKLLKQRQVHFIATDAHDMKKRLPCLSNSADFVRKKYGEDYCRELFYNNPLHVILNEEIALY